MAGLEKRSREEKRREENKQMGTVKAVREVFRFFERCQAAERQGGISPASLLESLGLLLGDGIDRRLLDFLL